MWQFGEAVEAKDFKAVERILELTLSHTLTSNHLNFCYVMFDRHLIQAFKGSNECFEIFISFLEKSFGFEQGSRRFKDELIFINRMVLMISPLWHYLYYLNHQEEKLRKLT